MAVIRALADEVHNCCPSVFEWDCPYKTTHSSAQISASGTIPGVSKRNQRGVCHAGTILFFRAVDPRIIRERVREREAKIAAKENKVRPKSGDR